MANEALLRIIGDVHAQVDFVIREGIARPYLQLIEDCQFSIQVGDMGDSIAYDVLRDQVDVQRHRFFPGNHDDYDNLPEHALGDFGEYELGGVSCFYIRGAQSSDMETRLRRQRKIGTKLWWEQEELSEDNMASVVAAYEIAKPRLVLSHDCPARISEFIRQDQGYGGDAGPTSRTKRLLQQLYEIHEPEIWCFGHYHRDWVYRDEKTEFRCIGELSFLDFDQHGQVMD